MGSFILHFGLVDVFAEEPLTGNGLSIFLLEHELPTELMQRITQEMRQFESIFLQKTGDPHCYTARIFTMEEELGFAGHPILGAACFVHAKNFQGVDELKLTFVTPEKSIPTVSIINAPANFAEMEQGSAIFQAPINLIHTKELLSALNLSESDVAENLPLQVVSTGLPYLIVPVSKGLDKACICTRQFKSLLAEIGAKFVYVLDVFTKEGRTWDNDGKVEDVATGSAAGPAAAYLVKHGLAQAGEVISIKQGRFVGRPSELLACVRKESGMVTVRGQVCFVGNGSIELPNQLIRRTDFIRR